jgi:hypothetical protein
MPAPPPESEKIEYETAENASYSNDSLVVKAAVTNDSPITCAAPVNAEYAPVSTSIPRNILSGTGILPVPLPQTFGGSVATDGMVDGTISKGVLPGNSTLPHKSAEDTGRIPVPPVYDEQAACDAISAALERRQRQRRLAKARRK